MSKNRGKAGFTMVELVVALGIIAMIAGLSIVTISVIPRMRQSQNVAMIKTALETTRDIAKSHGGDASLTITKTEEGVTLTMDSLSVENTEEFVEDRSFEVYYKRTGEGEERTLGEDDDSLTFRFSQTIGSFIGEDMIDYIAFSNEGKYVRLVLLHQSGLIEYDYNMDDTLFTENEEKSADITVVTIPSIVVNGILNNNGVRYSYTGEAIQPELSYNSRYVKIGGTYRAIKKGSYNIQWSLKDPSTTKWSDGTTEDKFTSWSIQ